MDSCLLIDDLSDHLPIVLYMDLHLPKVKMENNSTTHKFSENAKEAFMNSLLNTDWTFVDDQISMKNINIFYNSFGLGTVCPRTIRPFIIKILYKKLSHKLFHNPAPI